MTEKALEKIIEEAKTKWPIYQVQIIHRVGNLDLGDQIVFVGVSSAHREAAFQACEFLMDYLKVDAPFWKKERTKSGDHWVEQKASDQKRASRW
jgi:molybdopterin synthase catalytic subunit